MKKKINSFTHTMITTMIEKKKHKKIAQSK